MWVFTPDLKISTSTPSSNQHGLKRAMKVFWQTITNPKEYLDKHDMSVEEITLPHDLHQALLSALDQSRAILPSSASTFQGWKVGIMERFSINEVI